MKKVCRTAHSSNFAQETFKYLDNLCKMMKHKKKSSFMKKKVF